LDCRTGDIGGFCSLKEVVEAIPKNQWLKIIQIVFTENVYQCSVTAVRSLLLRDAVPITDSRDLAVKTLVRHGHRR